MDARSLLRAKKAEARIDHPYAAYNAAGQLRCSVCAAPVKSFQWDAHIFSKQHRQSVQREKEAQAKLAAKSKRPAESSDEPAFSKRAKLDEPAKDEDEEEEGDAGPSTRSALPAGFFSAGNRPAAMDEDEGQEEQAAQASSAAAAAPLPAATGDAELDDFLATLNEPETAEVAPQAGTSSAPVRKRGAIRLGGDEAPAQASYSAAPVLVNRAEQAEEAAEEEAEPEETEEERRNRLAQEEREEIMGRLEEEERAQEDADSRVTHLKARMELLKKRKEARAGHGALKASKAKTTADANGS